MIEPESPAPIVVEDFTLTVIIISVVVSLLILSVIILCHCESKEQKEKKKQIEESSFQDALLPISTEEYVKKNRDRLIRTGSQKLEITKYEFFARYNLIKKIGQGGFSTVFLYEDLVLSQEVAVKVMAYNNPEEFESIKTEIQIAEKSQHFSQIVQIRNYFYDREHNIQSIYLVMELAKYNLEAKI